MTIKPCTCRAFYCKTKVEYFSNKKKAIKKLKYNLKLDSWMQKNIAGTIFYSLLFAMGGAPTIAMIMIKLQNVRVEYIYQTFIGLTVMIACVLIPLILLQNTYLFLKRKNEELNKKLDTLCHVYLVIDIFALIFWLIYPFI